MNVITTFRNRPKLHRFFHFVPLIYPTVMVFEEVHMPRSLCRLNSVCTLHSLPTSQRWMQKSALLNR